MILIGAVTVGGLGLLFLSVALPWLAVNEWHMLLGEEGLDMVNNLSNAIMATVLSLIVMAIDVRIAIFIFRCCRKNGTLT